MLFWVVLTTLGLAAMAYFLKLPNRVLQPALTLMLFGVLLSSAASTRRSPGRNWLAAAAVTFVLLGAWPQWQLRDEQTAAIKANRARISAWWANYPDSLWERPTLISLPVYLHLLVDGDPLANYNLPPDPVLVDGWVARLPSYQSMAYERIGSTSYGAQWCRWASQEAVLVSSEENADFFSRFLLGRYGLEMEMKRIWSREGISAFALAVPNLCDTL
jgi:hypothetical protein